MVHEEDVDIETMNSLSLIPSSTGNVSIGAYTAFYYPLYFQLPPQFYGDRTKSYGGFLRFSVLTGGAQTPMDRNILQHFPLVQIHSYNKLVLDYYQVSINIAASPTSAISANTHYKKSTFIGRTSEYIFK